MVSRYLRRSIEPEFQVDWCGCLADARDVLAEGRHDVVLLDLNLPDSRALKTLETVVDLVPRTAVIVLTGAGDHESGLEAVRMGAQDYLSKDDIDCRLLHRVLSHAVERQTVHNAVSLRFAKWSKVIQSIQLGDTDSPLEKRLPRVFCGLVDMYSVLLALDEAEREESASYTGALRELVRRLVGAQASSADVLAIHVAAIGRRMQVGAKVDHTREEEQLLLFRVLGHIVTGYRDTRAGELAGPRRWPREMV